MLAFDLNLPLRKGGGKYDVKTVKPMLQKLGYSGGAINTIVEAKELLERKKGLPEPVVAVPPEKDDEDNKARPLSLPETPGEPSPKKIVLLQRLTISVDSAQEVAAVGALVSKNRKCFDIVAMRPTTEEAIDKAADKKGIVFELAYAAAIRDQSLRRNLFSNASELIRLKRKGRRILITSEATHSMELRGVHDVVNLGVLFGLREADAIAALTIVPKRVISMGKERLHAKAKNVSCIVTTIVNDEAAERKN
eukprot:jgi/Bigna1/68281/fgenesh1_pg.5_\